MKKPSRIKAILLAVVVTIIWSTSWVLIKIGLADIPAMTFAGLRYMLASLLFFPLLLKKDIRAQIKGLSARQWAVMVLLGVVLYTIGQGGQFLGLAYLPSVTVSLILNLSALFVAIVSSITIKERLTWLQWLGVMLNLAGVVIYFNPASNPMHGHWLGWLFAVLSLLGNSVGVIIGREVNRKARIHPIVITGISMTIGSALMLLTGILWQGLPPLSAQSIWIIVILAVVNTAVCFTIWNYTQQTLMATETAILNNTMLVYISVLAWIFLDEKQSPMGIVGLILALVGAMLVQIQLKKQPDTPRPDML
jgi:drug/metabolite transporter (DMT)-like permease